MMLILSRSIGEKILIGDDVTVTVVEVRYGKVRLGIDAPRTMSVDREEVRKDKKEKNAKHQETIAPGKPIPDEDPSDLRW